MLLLFIQLCFVINDRSVGWDIQTNNQFSFVTGQLLSCTEDEERIYNLGLMESLQFLIPPRRTHTRDLVIPTRI